jgi:hypothetical protein
MYIAPAFILNPAHLPHLKPLEQIDNPHYKDISKDEAAKELGIKSFDVSLPQSWVEYCRQKLGVNPVPHVVWSYDTSRFGNPVGITREGRTLVTILDHLSS